jgi:hypothetical protein
VDHDVKHVHYKYRKTKNLNQSLDLDLDLNPNLFQYNKKERSTIQYSIIIFASEYFLGFTIAI